MKRLGVMVEKEAVRLPTWHRRCEKRGKENAKVFNYFPLNFFIKEKCFLSHIVLKTATQAHGESCKHVSTPQLSCQFCCTSRETLRHPDTELNSSMSNQFF